MDTQTPICEYCNKKKTNMQGSGWACMNENCSNNKPITTIEGRFITLKDISKETFGYFNK